MREVRRVLVRVSLHDARVRGGGGWVLSAGYSAGCWAGLGWSLARSGRAQGKRRLLMSGGGGGGEWMRGRESQGYTLT